MINASVLGALWRYRGFVFGNVKRDFQLRYKGSALGVTWQIINPVAMIIVYTVIFAAVMRARLPGIDDTLAYGIYLCAGLLPWGLFSEIIGRSQTVFIENGNLLKKSSFPRICLPAVLIVSALINFAIIFGLFLGFLAITDRFPGLLIVSMLPVLIVQMTFAIGLGMLVGTLNVFLRDVGQFMGVVLQFWFWLTPIVYPPSILPEAVRGWLHLNPMFPVISAYQDIFLNHKMPVWENLIPVAALSLLLFAVGYAVFRRNAGELVDEL